MAIYKIGRKARSNEMDIDYFISQITQFVFIYHDYKRKY